MAERTILIIAGPNGAGKTTFAREFLLNEGNCPTFVNADLIAEGLNPLQPEEEAVAAGRMMLNMIRDYVGRGRSFAFETTLSGRTYARMIPQWQAQGYRVRLFFLRLPTPEVAIARVAKRVATGGHNIPDDVVRRRFQAGWYNFEHIYRDLVDEWAVYDGTGSSPVFLAEGGIPGRREELMVTQEKEKRTTAQEERNPYWLGAEAALKRAVKKARRRDIALTGSAVTYRDGKVVYDTEP